MYHEEHVDPAPRPRPRRPLIGPASRGGAERGDWTCAPPPRHPPPLPARRPCASRRRWFPPFLDRIYYRGPGSATISTGTASSIPGPPDPPAARSAAASSTAGRGGERAAWPDHVPVRPTVPPRRVEGDEMLVTWIGHATVLVQTQGLNILTDPIWSERASPFSFIGPTPGPRAGRALRGSAEDRPRPRQPQSLRPYGPADAEAAVGRATGR